MYSLFSIFIELCSDDFVIIMIIVIILLKMKMIDQILHEISNQLDFLETWTVQIELYVLTDGPLHVNATSCLI